VNPGAVAQGLEAPSVRGADRVVWRQGLHLGEDGDQLTLMHD
jgi:hypothetical protein